MPGLLEAGLTVIDLSGAFDYARRLNIHAITVSSTAGRSASISRLWNQNLPRIDCPRADGNPGCYPVGSHSNGAAGWVESSIPTDHLRFQVRSHGSGQDTHNKHTHFSEVTENFRPTICSAIAIHPRSPRASSTVFSEVVFTPHLLPSTGHLSTIYFRPAAGASLGTSRPHSLD